VQVFSKNEKHLYGRFLAIPDQRMRPARKPVITFDETPGGSPEAVKAWFYPGENYGPAEFTEQPSFSELQRKQRRSFFKSRSKEF